MLDFGFYNMDCMAGMREFPDKFFDLAIVDPPYGGGATPSAASGDSSPASGGAERDAEALMISGGGYGLEQAARTVRRVV